MAFLALVRLLIRRVVLHWRLFLRKWWTGSGVFNHPYVLVNNAQVTLYTDDATCLPAYARRESLREHLGRRAVQASLIAPVKNEALNALEWCESIAGQTRPPDEVIVVDAGSHDGTLEEIRAWAAQSRVPFRVIVEPGCTIARARNVAITAAHYPIIAATDFGCIPRPDWLEKVVAPFESNSETCVVAGLYAPVDSQRRDKWCGFSIYPNLRRINPQNYIPSSRSIAFTKQVWSAAGGYPEWLTLTGEDTYFDRELQRIGGQWALVPDAIVEWFGPENLLAYSRKAFVWAGGDGESGLHANLYWRYVLHLTVVSAGIGTLFILGMLIGRWQIDPAIVLATLTAACCSAGILASRITGVPIPVLVSETILEGVRVAGFIRGTRRRNAALKRRLASVRGVFFILSGVPIDDTGGGARATQWALELLRQGYAVVFIHRFPRYESKTLDLAIGHPCLFHYALKDFRWEAFQRAEGQWVDVKPLAAVVEFPLRDFLPVIRKLRAHKGVVVYDLLDLWETTLGGKWYTPVTESQIAQASQLLVATAPVLVERLNKMTGRTVAYLPNAVNHRLFDPNRHHPRPADMPRGEWTAIYTGALWGEWFDWNLLVTIAQKNARAAIVVIGDYHGQCSFIPPNLHFLGLKAQRELPAYLEYADVAIIPWKIEKLTHATSPLKAYEYLAMHKPVVAPAIEPLGDLPGVWLARDETEFLEKMHVAHTTAFPAMEVDHFLKANDWQARVETLLMLIEDARQQR